MAPVFFISSERLSSPMWHHRMAISPLLEERARTQILPALASDETHIGNAMGQDDAEVKPLDFKTELSSKVRAKMIENIGNLDHDSEWAVYTYCVWA